MNTLPRSIRSALSDRLRVMPVVVVTGARQTGKSTLAEQLVSRRRYTTLDDLDTLDAARRGPQVLAGGPGALTVDEIQREPELLRATKRVGL